MGVHRVQDHHVGAMVKLHLARCLAVLLRKVAPVELVLPLEHWVMDGADAGYGRLAVVERCAAHEGAPYVVALCALQGDVVRGE